VVAVRSIELKDDFDGGGCCFVLVFALSIELKDDFDFVGGG